MNFDELKECTRCGSDACYKQEVSKDISLELCYGCGFQHNSIMVKDSDFYKEQMEILPEIYKVLMDEDEEEKMIEEDKKNQVKCECDICSQMNDIVEKWQYYEPKDDLGKVFKKHIDFI